MTGRKDVSGCGGVEMKENGGERIGMRAIILAAGYARRMRPLSDATHKTLLPVAGKTIIGRIMDGLIANGIRETVDRLPPDTAPKN